jgi:putative transposase
MTRPLRIEYAGACYHVISRGNYRAPVFEEPGAKEAFLGCLWEACRRAGWVVHAYVVMRNHYHLALETPEPNLVRGMQWLQATFARRFNRFKKEQGHVFQGRYKSIHLGSDHSLAAVCHYIHLNPVRARLVAKSDLAGYRYSSLALLKCPNHRPNAFQPARFLAYMGFADQWGGWESYVGFLQWLLSSTEEQRRWRFGVLSRGWASKEPGFRAQLLARLARPVADDFEKTPRKEEWDAHLDRHLIEAGRSEECCRRFGKWEDWKVKVAAKMKTETTASNKWLCRKLALGHPRILSRYIKRYK